MEVSDAHGVHAMVTRVSDAENAAREAIAMVLGIDPKSFAVVFQRD